MSAYNIAKNMTDEACHHRVLSLIRRRQLVPQERLSRAEKSVAAMPSVDSAAPSRVLEWLVEHGDLTRQQVAELVLEVSRELPTEATSPHPLPPESLPDNGHPPDVPPDWRRYTNFSLLGAGGMGTVYRAFDPRLRRWVALKFLHADDREVAEACLREARAQARVEHENICQIYEVGEVGRRLYIAMQYLEGQTLRSLAPTLTFRDIAEVAAQVARALHAAHLHGLVHRDVKPSNIMVEQTSDGRSRPYVLDFGLARDLSEASGATLTGAVLGTPSYMAPEQARGDLRAIDPRSDVYSLGATLYDLLAGAPPFAGSIAQVLLGVLEEEPVPLQQRRPGVPADLAAIVARCLEKDPSRRYPNALAVAEDLERFLSGEPVVARAQSLWYLLARRARKHRVILAAAGLALVAITGATTVAVTSLLAARRQGELTQLFARELKTVEESVRLVYSRPLHDVRPEFVRLRQRLDWIADKAARAGRVGVGPGNHALAAGLMAIGEYARAEEHLRRAWEAGYRPPEVAHALALVLVARYRESLSASQQLRDPELREAERRYLQETYRRPAMAFLEQARGATLEAGELAEAQIAFLEDRFEEALAKARQARQRIPWLYQAAILEGEVHLQQARYHLQGGLLPQCAAALEEARAAFGQATMHGPSDPAVYMGLCDAANLASMAASEAGISPEAAYHDALTTCGQALTADPDHLRAHKATALAHLQWGNYRLARGQEVTSILLQASRAAERVVQISPADPEGWTYLGIAARLGAEVAGGRGEDRRPKLAEAISHLRRALDLAPESYLAANNLGLALLTAGLDDLDRGKDPRPAMHQAVKTFESILTTHPRLVAAMDNLAVALWAIGRFEYAHGEDGQPSFDRAEKTLRRALEVNPLDWVAHNNLGLLAAEQGAFLLSQGVDPTTVLGTGQEILTGLLARNPEDPYAFTNLGQIYRLQAEWEQRQGRSPAAALQQARWALTRAQAINPADAEAALAEGLCALVEARAAMATGRSPEPAFTGAQRAIGRALAINPVYLEAHRSLARLHLERAHWLAQQKRSAEEDLRRGLEVLSPLPLHPETQGLRGELTLLESRLARGTAQVEAARRAAADLAAAIAANRWLAPRLEPLLRAAEALAL